MSAVILLLVLVTIVAVAAVLHEVGTDDPRRARTYTPPRSHRPDPFEVGGSTYR